MTQEQPYRELPEPDESHANMLALRSARKRQAMCRADMDLDDARLAEDAQAGRTDT